MFTCFSAQVLALMVDLEDCIVSCRCSPVSVPQVLAMMADLEDCIVTVMFTCFSAPGVGIDDGSGGLYSDLWCSPVSVP